MKKCYVRYGHDTPQATKNALHLLHGAIKAVLSIHTWSFILFCSCQSNFFLFGLFNIIVLLNFIHCQHSLFLQKYIYALFSPLIVCRPSLIYSEQDII